MSMRISTWVLLLLLIPPAATTYMVVLQLLLLITLELTPLTIKVLCHQVVCMGSLPAICRLPTLEQWEDQACHPSIDQGSHLFMAGSHLSIRQLVVEVLA